MRVLLYILAIVSAITAYDANANDDVKIATLTEGDLFAKLTHSVACREWTPMADTMIPQKVLVAKATSIVKKRLGDRQEMSDTRLTYVTWTRSFEGWWFLQVYFFLTPPEGISFRGEEFEIVHMLPNGALLQLVERK
jgi:hypothetical protein